MAICIGRRNLPRAAASMVLDQAPSLPCSRLRSGGTRAAGLARPTEERCSEPAVSVGRQEAVANDAT